MQRCQRCIMPGIPRLITLDEDGICHQCRNYRPIRMKGEKELITLLDSHRKRKSEYDCIVTVSGGRDSAFTLLKLVKDYKLKVLAVNYENPFADDQAKANIKNMIKKLSVDLVQFKFGNNIHEKILKNNIIAWFHKPSPAMVPVICVGCKIIWPRIMKIAKEHNIRCIVNGGNPYEYTSFKKELLGVNQNAGLVSAYFFNIFRLAREALHNLSYLKPKYLPFTIKGFLFANQYAIGSRLLGFKLDKIDLFHYITWNEDEVLTRIQNELDWQPPADLVSTWRFDCRLSLLKDFMYLTCLGVTEKDDFYSKLVRESKMSRREALQRIEKENELHVDVIEDIFHQLGIEDIDVSRWYEKNVH
ncbi:ATPase [bacterium]|nr:ATPase [bacterium]